MQSSKSANVDAIRQARTQGMIAAYLNIAAIISALIFAAVVIGLVVGIEGREFSLQMCINRGRFPINLLVVRNLQA